MKHLLLLLLFPLFVYSQYCPSIGPDLNLPCGVTQTTLTADLSQCGQGANPNGTSNYTVTTIPYVTQTNNGTLVSLGDDVQSNTFNIGFTFCYYGSIYTQFRIGSNGWISLGAGVQPGTFTSVGIPNAAATVPKNCIMGPWQDWNPGIGGQVRYQVQGVAPCRKLVVSWIGVPMFSCTNLLGTFHIVIYESTNVIENYIANKPNCPQWAGGTSVQGVHNLTGTQAVTVPGRNSTQWTAVNDARRYTPSGPVIQPVLTWYQVGNPVSIGTGQSITVTPPLGGAYYTCHLEYGACNAGWSTCNQQGVGLGPDTIHVVPTPVLPTPNVVINNPLCNNSCDGSILVTPVGGNGVQTISWNGNQTGLNPTGLCAGTYLFTLSDATGCNYNGTATLIAPPPLQQPTILPTDPTCFGYCDGSATVNPVDGVAPFAYLWNNNQTTQTATNLCSGNYSVTVYDANNCPATQNTTLVDPPMVTINQITGSDTICYNSTTNLYNITSVFPNLGYVWTTTIGNITTGQGTNQINLDVTGVNGGLYTNALSVIGVNQLGCQSLPQTFTIVDLNILPVINPVGPFCEYDECITLMANPSGGNFSGMNVWGDQYCPNNGFIGLDQVNYTYNQSGCWFDTSTIVQVYPRPLVTPVVNGIVGEDNVYHELCEGDTITDIFDAISVSGGFNEWYHFGDTTVNQTLSITWDQDGIFQFEVVRWDNGCVSNPQNYYATIELCPNEIFYIPNSFTPNGDERNNTFKPIITSGVDLFNYSFYIYNRWGQVIWESYNPNTGWDGTFNTIMCQDGVYTWKLKFKTPKTDEIKEFMGSLTLIR
jgi:gliding motility-associated-like protein